MGASFPKQPCLENCLERVGSICDERDLKRPSGDKAAKVQIECGNECREINKIMSIQHASDQFVSNLADDSCGPKGSGGKGKSQFYSVQIRGTNTQEGNSEGSGAKAQKMDRRLEAADDLLKIMESRRSDRTWYQSLSDHLGGPTEPSRKKLEEFKSLIGNARALKEKGDLKGASDVLDLAWETGLSADREYYAYFNKSLDHAEKVGAIQLGVGVVLFIVGSAGAGIAYGLGGAAAGGTVTGGAEVISLTARLAARQGAQEALKRAAILLLGWEATRREGTPEH